MTQRLKHWLIIAGVTVTSTALLWLSVGMTKIYENYDGPYYIAVAKSLYNKDYLGKNFSFPVALEYYPAHFPLYPIFIRLTGMGPIGDLRGMLIVNLAATTAAALVLYHIASEKKWGNPLLIALAFLFLWPRMWVIRSIGSPETLFLLWIMLALHAFENKKYWQTALWGSLAVFTKSPGILLLGGVGLWTIIEFIKAKKTPGKMWPVSLILAALLAVFGFYYLRTGDFWAYFHSGDNIHLQVLPFRIFSSNQPWVGTFWLEDVLWLYLISAIGVARAWKKSLVWGTFGAVYLGSILFVSHRDIGRYSLPLVPVVLLGLAELLERKEVRWALLGLILPMYLYSVNFLNQNILLIANWKPLF